MVRLVWSEVAVVKIVARGCWTARKVGGSAIAAASNKRLIVMPPEVTATTESGLLLSGLLLSTVTTNPELLLMGRRRPKLRRRTPELDHSGSIAVRDARRAISAPNPRYQRYRKAFR